jgi:hypothetical protein
MASKQIIKRELILAPFFIAIAIVECEIAAIEFKNSIFALWKQIDRKK